MVLLMNRKSATFAVAVAMAVPLALSTNSQAATSQGARGAWQWQCGAETFDHNPKEQISYHPQLKPRHYDVVVKSARCLLRWDGGKTVRPEATVFSCMADAGSGMTGQQCRVEGSYTLISPSGQTYSGQYPPYADWSGRARPKGGTHPCEIGDWRLTNNLHVTVYAESLLDKLKDRVYKLGTVTSNHTDTLTVDEC